MIATSVVGGGQEKQYCQAAAKLRPRLSRIHRLLRKCNYASRVGAGAAVMSGMVSFSIFFTLQWFFTNFTIMLLCRCVRKDSSKAAQSCYSPQASPGVEGEIHLWHFSTQLCNYVTEVATNVYPFRPFAPNQLTTEAEPSCTTSLSSDTMAFLALWLCLALPCHKDLQ